MAALLPLLPTEPADDNFQRLKNFVSSYHTSGVDMNLTDLCESIACLIKDHEWPVSKYEDIICSDAKNNIVFMNIFFIIESKIDWSLINAETAYEWVDKNKLSDDDVKAIVATIENEQHRKRVLQGMFDNMFKRSPKMSDYFIEQGVTVYSGHVMALALLLDKRRDFTPQIVFDYMQAHERYKKAMDKASIDK